VPNSTTLPSLLKYQRNSGKAGFEERFKHEQVARGDILVTPANVALMSSGIELVVSFYWGMSQSSQALRLAVKLIAGLYNYELSLT